MNGPDTDGLKDAMDAELGTLTNMESWVTVTRTKEMNVIGSTWAFKVKRVPNGTINKLKACLCVLRDQQIEGVDVFDTLGWVSAQINYTSAFVNAAVIAWPDTVPTKLPSLSVGQAKKTGMVTSKNNP
eukprot:1381251-Ditylum_brightwellii.AAC.1